MSHSCPTCAWVFRLSRTSDAGGGRDWLVAGGRRGAWDGPVQDAWGLVAALLWGVPVVLAEGHPHLEPLADGGEAGLVLLRQRQQSGCRCGTKARH